MQHPRGGCSWIRSPVRRRLSCRVLRWSTIRQRTRPVHASRSACTHLSPRHSVVFVTGREARSFGVGSSSSSQTLRLPCIWLGQLCSWSSSFVLTSHVLGSCWQVSTRIAGSAGWAGALHRVQRTQAATRVYFDVELCRLYMIWQAELLPSLRASVCLRLVFVAIQDNLQGLVASGEL